MKRSSVRPSVCLSHRSTASAACGGFAAERPAESRYRSMQATALRSKCGQCHVDNRGTRLNTDLFVLRWTGLYFSLDIKANENELTLHTTQFGLDSISIARTLSVQTALNRGSKSDRAHYRERYRVTCHANRTLTVTLTYDLHIQPPAATAHVKIKVKNQFIQKTEWKQTDRRTRPIAVPSR